MQSSREMAAIDIADVPCKLVERKIDVFVCKHFESFVKLIRLNNAATRLNLCGPTDLSTSFMMIAVNYYAQHVMVEPRLHDVPK
jgi:hypothetical protein